MTAEARKPWRKTWRISGLILILSAIGLMAWSGQPLAAGVGRWLAVQTPLRRADLVVALGGDRIRQEEAVKLLRQGMGRWLMFVGADVRPRDYRCLDVRADQTLPPPPPAYTTYEEALATRRVVQGRGVRSVLVVTSPYHLRRARLIFERAFRGTGTTLMFSTSPNEAFTMEDWWRSHIGRKLVFMEYLGLAYYWLRV